MTTTPRRRVPEPFDASRDFVVRRDLRVNGKDLARGASFDKTAVPTRRLRLLFDQGLITMGSPAVEETKPASYLAGLSTTQLRDWLKLRGQKVRGRPSHAKLLEQAEQVIREDENGLAA